MRGAAAPAIAYGGLNALLFVTYNQTLKTLNPRISDPSKLAGLDLSKIWLAGAVGGSASWVISSPSELIKCRAQLASGDNGASSYRVLREVWQSEGIRGFYLGGVTTCLRDSVGYGFYFWSYELSKRLLLSRQADPFVAPSNVDVLVSGGIAGVITWCSIYPLDVIKTRMQAPVGLSEAHEPLMVQQGNRSALRIARGIYVEEGIRT